MSFHDALENEFKDFKPPLSDSEAQVEAHRCINCYDAPCIRACPTSINIPQFISRISSQDTAGAAQTILDSNIMGLSCATACPTEVLCEGSCVYHKLNQKPLLIGKLQRYAVEYAYARGIQFYSAGPSTGKRVALVGAGPASLACAHELRRKGHAPTIFEKSTVPGGLNTQGIAPYKMKASVSLREIEQIRKIGIEFQFEKELGRNLELSDLLRDYDAVFLGMGLGPDSPFPAAGQHPRVFGAVHWISKLKTEPASQMSWIRSVKSALVIGGGNTALDACRELKALKIPKVSVSYRRKEEDMSGYSHELKWARQEGVEFLFQTLPIEFRPLNPESLGVTLQKTQTTSTGKVELVSEKFDIMADLVLVATGQSKFEQLLNDTRDNPKIFAGGDFLNGGKEVVNAVAEGKRAALAIHERLSHG